MIAENNSARDVLFKIRVSKIEAFPPRFTEQELEGGEGHDGPESS
jgi:hypothetical protein